MKKTIDFDTLYASGMSLKEIAREMHTTLNAIYAHMHDDYPDLRKEDEKDISQLHDVGFSDVEIAGVVGITVYQVTRFLNVKNINERCIRIPVYRKSMVDREMLRS